MNTSRRQPSPERFLKVPVARILLISLGCLFTVAVSVAVAADLEDGLGGIVDSKGAKDAPVYVTSDSLELDAKSRVFNYRGNVEVTQAEMKMTCDVMRGEYDKANELKTIVCNDNVVITNGPDTRATSSRATFFVPQSRIELTEAPELVKNGSVLAADKILIFVREDRSEAQGNVRVKVLKPSEQQALEQQAADLS